LNCQDIEPLIHGYADGELDLMTSLEVERHFQDCAQCAQAHTTLKGIRARIKDGIPYYSAPEDLARRVRSSLRGAGRGDRSLAARPGPLLLAVAASLAMIMATGWGLARVLQTRSEDAVLTLALVASHVRSQMLPSHQFDVASSDAHTVKPWFEGKLDFSPPVKDLARQGFPLVGGRLDYLQNRAVAALVYRRRKHSINLFIWPSPSRDEASDKKSTQQGFHIIQWTRSGMTFSAISDLNEGELQEFVRLVPD
jgi:anti-sigma factor RsiW